MLGCSDCPACLFFSLVRRTAFKGRERGDNEAPSAHEKRRWILSSGAFCLRVRIARSEQAFSVRRVKVYAPFLFACGVLLRSLRQWEPAFQALSRGRPDAQG
jgi:hypothetical protein